MFYFLGKKNLFWVITQNKPKLYQFAEIEASI